MASVRALRGATTVDRDDAGHMADRVEALLRAMLESNGIGTDALVSLIFSATADLRGTFPAAAARSRFPDLADVPLLEGETPTVRWRWALPAACGLVLVGLVTAGRLRRLGGLLG